MAAGPRSRQREIMPPKRTPTRSPVVCGVDRSPHARSAARLAILLARRLHRPLELVHVIEGPPRPSPGGAMEPVQAVLNEQTDVEGVRVRLLSGPAASALADAAQRSWLLVIGSRGEGAARPAPLGTVSGALTGDPPCPTVVVPPTTQIAVEELTGRAIVCAVRDERDLLAAHAAAKLASALGQSLTLAHVIRRTVPATPGAHREASRMLGRIARPIAANLACAIDLQVLDGAPGPQLDRLATAKEASLLAVGASERGPLAAALAGSPSRHLMRHGQRPVLIHPRARRPRRRRAKKRPVKPARGAFAWQGRV